MNSTFTTGVRRRSARSGFTLIELLVVVAIVSLLISILLPTMRGARDQSRRLVCTNNLRSIWTGVLMYAYEYRDRVPYMENVNRRRPGWSESGPNADPFDPRFRQTVGVVLMNHVNPDSWVCPSAVDGFPRNAGSGGWKMTYDFSTADFVTGIQPVPYDQNPLRGTTLDPAVTNYVHFDGRPLRLIDGRRYLPRRTRPEDNESLKGFWSVRREIFGDLLLDEAAQANAARKGGYVYPHRGTLDPRPDLFMAESLLNANANITGRSDMTGRMELHADGEQAGMLFTRFWEQHEPGY